MDIDTLTKEQLQHVNWDKLLGTVKPDLLDPHLTPAQIHSIIENNKEISDWVKAHPGEHLTSERVETILHPEHIANDVQPSSSRLGVVSAITEAVDTPHVDMAQINAMDALSGEITEAINDLKQTQSNELFNKVACLGELYGLDENESAKFAASLAGEDNALTWKDFQSSGIYNVEHETINQGAFIQAVSEFKKSIAPTGSGVQNAAEIATNTNTGSNQTGAMEQVTAGARVEGQNIAKLLEHSHISPQAKDYITDFTKEVYDFTKGRELSGPELHALSPDNLKAYYRFCVQEMINDYTKDPSQANLEQLQNTIIESKARAVNGFAEWQEIKKSFDSDKYKPIFKSLQKWLTAK